MKAPEPPDYRQVAEDAAERCGICKMRDPDTGECWGFGDKLVGLADPDFDPRTEAVCNDWAAEPDATETKSARGGHAMTDVQTPEGDATPEADRAGRRAGASDETRALREEMRGVREARRVPISQFEIREVPNGSGGTNLEFEGYASVTCADEEDLSHSYEMEDWCGPYEELVLRGAFTKTLAENADVAFLVNHGAGGGVTMARTKPGTLKLFEDLVGLHVAATLNPARSDVQILKAAVADGALDEMSFAFRVVRQKWSWAEDNGVIDRRFMQELNLDKGDVSPVNYGANPHTGGLVSMRSAMTLLNGRGLNFETLAAALKEIRAGATISQATRDVLQPILNHLASIDEMVDTDQADLSELLGVANPDEDDDGDSESESAPEAEKLAAPVYVLPDHTARAWADLAEMRRR